MRFRMPNTVTMASASAATSTMGIGRAKGSNYEPHTYKATHQAFAHEATGNGCNYDDAESRPDCISNTDRDGFQNQRKKIKCDAITDYDNGGRGKLSKALARF
ncbi:hypothetical protein BANRA_05564 [Klebsiella pneumoniae]|nr:hypothetical protein BANRA_05564 [Klebsiella pneumoniae]